VLSHFQAEGWRGIYTENSVSTPFLLEEPFDSFSFARLRDLATVVWVADVGRHLGASSRRLLSRVPECASCSCAGRCRLTVAAAPLDIDTDAFYTSRVQQIEEQLAKIREDPVGLLRYALQFRGVCFPPPPSSSLLVRVMHPHIMKDANSCLIKVLGYPCRFSWDFSDPIVLEIIQCVGGERLARICHVMASTARHRIIFVLLW
jgi:hypothetical protein